MSDASVVAGYAAAHGRLEEARKIAPSMSDTALEEALQRAESALLGEGPVPDGVFAMAAAAGLELARRAGPS